MSLKQELTDALRSIDSLKVDAVALTRNIARKSSELSLVEDKIRLARASHDASVKNSEQQKSLLDDQSIKVGMHEERSKQLDEYQKKLMNQLDGLARVKDTHVQTVLDAKARIPDVKALLQSTLDEKYEITQNIQKLSSDISRLQDYKKKLDSAGI